MSSDHDDPLDPLAARLRAALTSEADMVNPSDDGLQHIRHGVDSAHRPWWRHPAALAVAAAAVLGLAVGGLAVALGGDDDPNVVAEQPSEDTTSNPEPSETTTDASEPAETREDLYVYYVVDDEVAGPRLFREVHSVAAGPPTAAIAVQEMLSVSAHDPDYSSPWPASTRVTTYNTSGDTATVDLSDFVSVGAEAESVAVQQVVYTVTANDPAVKQVRLLVNGEAPESGHMDWSEPVTRAPMVDVQGLIWLLGPTQDATVASPVEITGYGTAFEATVSWEARRAGSDEVVAEGFTQAGANGEFDEFSDTVELEPGSYEIRAFESSAEDGRPLHVDTKTFTVE